MFLAVLALAIETPPAKPRYAFEEPAMAVLPTGEIRALLISPLFREPFQCGDHKAGE